MRGRCRNMSFRWTVLVWLAVLLLCWQNVAAETPPIYSKVRIEIQSPEDLQRLQAGNITLDHFEMAGKTAIELVLQSSEVAMLPLLGMNFEVLIADMAKHIENRAPITPAELAESRRIQHADNVSGFDFGSMGGFYTMEEIEAAFDTMAANYPNIITPKNSIGLSVQGRNIWMLKISDNPGDDESATEAAVYYDALHHAREPASMAVTLYYMFWLLENYGTDPHATYLVDNREMYFVPVVNPDGYAYNQQTNPNGGGFWRKNRRNISGCFGVDLNRNYSFGYNTGGSSNDPCSDIYHGAGAFSEPETQAVRDFLMQIDAKIAFSSHSVRGAYLNPYGYTATSPAFDVYSEFSSDFAAQNQYIYGRTSEILGYTSSGTTRDYLHSIGIYAWTPEIAGSGFWPSQSEIMPLVSENLYPMKYLSWVSGAYADFKNFSYGGIGYARPGDTLDLHIAVRNRGLSLPAENVSVTLSSTHPHAIPIVNTVDYEIIPPRSSDENLINPFRFLLTTDVQFLDEIPFTVSVSQDGVVTVNKTIWITVGQRGLLFKDSAEEGMLKWQVDGSGQNWDTTSVGSYDGAHSFSDSRYGNSPNSASNTITMKNFVNITESYAPRLEYWAKWATEEDFDYVRVQLQTNINSTWQTLTGDHTSSVFGQQGYNGLSHWVQESIDLSAYIGTRVKIRFLLSTDSGLNGDGFYFDQLRIVDYTPPPIVGIDDESGILPKKIALGQNYPNPFNPSTVIYYDLPVKYAGKNVSLTIYNSLGQVVKTLINQPQGAGRKSIRWDGKNDAGQSVGSGIYVYSLRVENLFFSKKMLLLK